MATIKSEDIRKAKFLKVDASTIAIENHGNVDIYLRGIMILKAGVGFEFSNIGEPYRFGCQIEFGELSEQQKENNEQQINHLQVITTHQNG